MKRMILAIFLILLTGNTAVEAQAPFYQGKTITFITGSNPGELFDLYVRTISQFMVKHIPGNPDAIVQNMPGAGHMIAANYVYNIAKLDGLTLAGRVDSSRNPRDPLHRSTRRSARGQVRLGKVYLDRQRWKVPTNDVHARRYSL